MALKATIKGFGLLLAAWLLSLNPAFSVEPQMDTDELFKPLVDTADTQSKPPEPLQGNALKKQPKSEPQALKIRVQTFQEAVVAEKDIVDWYAWYLTVRAYLKETGSLSDCEVGTPIKIYKKGRIEALSPDPICRTSVAWRKFPLPEKTRLEALILPVRSGKLPPASPTELQMRLRQSGSAE